MNPRALVPALFALAALMMASCGFHLRGQAELPPAMAVTYLEAEDTRSQVYRALRRSLERSGVDVTRNPDRATATIRILEDRTSRRTLAAGPTGEAREYELRSEVEFDVRLASGETLIARDRIVTRRDALYDEVQVLGRSAGEEILLQDMAADTARDIVRRLQAAAPRRS